MALELSGGRGKASRASHACSAQGSERTRSDKDIRFYHIMDLPNTRNTDRNVASDHARAVLQERRVEHVRKQV